MKIFLTGGTGFVGRHLTQALLKSGWEVTVLVYGPEDGPEARAILSSTTPASTGTEWVDGDELRCPP